MLFLDIETTMGTPDVSGVDDVPPANLIEAPKNYKDPDKISEYQQREHLRLVAAREAKLVELGEATALEPLEGAVLCVGIARDDGPVRVLWEPTEAETLAVLAKGLAAYPGHPICTWNGLTFDLPFLWRRALHHRVTGLPARLYAPKPWGNHRHVDLYSIWSAAQRRARGRLPEVARYLGIEVEPDLDGAGVPTLWASATDETREQIRQQITAHVTQDVRLTRAVAEVFDTAGILAAA